MTLLLGREIDIVIDGEAVGLSPTQKCYLVLVVHGREEGVRREEVIRLMWGGTDDAPARHRVRQLSYTVNRKCGTEVIQADGPWLRLADAVEIDWDGSTFWEFIDAPTVAYRDHMSAVGERLEKSEALDSVRRLDAARRADAPAQVFRALEEGPRPPDAWRDILWALLRTGRIREAEFELKRILGDDLPAEGPSVARRLATVAEELLDIAAAGTDGDLPLLGREEDANRLQELIVSGAPCILLTGVHGVGRSRMLGQAVAGILSSREDAVVLSATGSPSERNVPFGGLSQLLDNELLVQAFQELGQPETEVIRRALPVQFKTEESHLLADLGGPGSYLRVAKAVTALLDRAFGPADVLLVVDDLDHLDRSSREVASRLTRTAKVRLIGTWCIQDVKSHNELLFRLQNLAPRVVHLGDLSTANAIALGRAVAGDLPPRELEDLARLSGGRPGRIVELARALHEPVAARRLLAPNLDEILRKRLRDLSAEAQEVLSILAISEGRMGVTTLTTVMGVGILEASGYVRELQIAGLVRVDSRKVAIVPRLLADFISRELPESLRQETHCRIADQLLEHPTRSEPGVIGHHLEAAGRVREAASWYHRAGSEAQERTGLAEAILFFQRHLAISEELDPSVAKALGVLHAEMGDFAPSTHWFGLGATAFQSRGKIREEIECSFGRIRSQLAQGDDVAILFRKIQTEIDRAQETRNSGLIAKGIDLWFEIADFSADHEQLSACVACLGFNLKRFPGCPRMALTGSRLTYAGNRELGLRLAKRGYLRLRHNPEDRLFALNRLIASHYVAGRSYQKRFTQLITLGMSLARGSGAIGTRFSLLGNSGLYFMDQELWDEAARCFQDADDLVPEPNTAQKRFLGINRGILCLRRGDYAGLEDHLELVQRLPDSPLEIERLSMRALEVFRHLETGRIGEAITAAKGIDQKKLDYPFSANLAIVAEALAELRRRQGRLEVAREILVRAVRQFRGANVPAANQVRRKLSRIL